MGSNVAPLPARDFSETELTLRRSIDQLALARKVRQETEEVLRRHRELERKNHIAERVQRLFKDGLIE